MQCLLVCATQSGRCLHKIKAKPRENQWQNKPVLGQMQATGLADPCNRMKTAHDLTITPQDNGRMMRF